MSEEEHVSNLSYLKGKTIKNVTTLYADLIINCPIIFEFTDNTNYTVLKCTEENFHGDAIVKLALLTLWDKANGKADYNKKEWTNLTKLLGERGIRI